MSIVEHGLLIFEGVGQRGSFASQRRVASMRPPTGLAPACFGPSIDTLIPLVGIAVEG